MRLKGPANLELAETGTGHGIEHDDPMRALGHFQTNEQAVPFGDHVHDAAAAGHVERPCPESGARRGTGRGDLDGGPDRLAPSPPGTCAMKNRDDDGGGTDDDHDAHGDDQKLEGA